LLKDQLYDLRADERLTWSLGLDVVELDATVSAPKGQGTSLWHWAECEEVNGDSNLLEQDAMIASGQGRIADVAGLAHADIEANAVFR